MHWFLLGLSFVLKLWAVICGFVVGILLISLMSFGLSCLVTVIQRFRRRRFRRKRKFEQARQPYGTPNL